MALISPETNIRDAIRAIGTAGQTPVVKIGGKTYVLNIRDTGRGIIIYTSFELGSPVESVEARYGSHHTVGDVIRNPVPKRRLDEIVDREIPVEPEILPISTIIGGYL